MCAYLINVLESVDYEALKGACVEYFVIVDVELVKRMDALYLTEENERVQERLYRVSDMNAKTVFTKYLPCSMIL